MNIEKKSIVDEPDLVLREIWQAKDVLSDEFGNDIFKLGEYLRKADQRRIKSSKRLEKAKVRRLS